MSDCQTCTKCGETKPLSEYYSNGKNGLHQSCKQCQRDVAKKARLANPEAFKERDKAKHVQNRDARLAKMREYSANNADRRAETERKRYEAEKDRIKARNYAYRSERPGLVRAWNNARRAVEKRATPLWADYKQIAEFYELAARLTQETGEPHHVDHVIPLRGTTVSGLHVQHNLQVLKAVDNLKKGARVECH